MHHARRNPQRAAWRNDPHALQRTHTHHALDGVEQLPARMPLRFDDVSLFVILGKGDNCGGGELKGAWSVTLGESCHFTAGYHCHPKRYRVSAIAYRSSVVP